MACEAITNSFSRKENSCARVSRQMSIQLISPIATITLSSPLPPNVFRPRQTEIRNNANSQMGTAVNTSTKRMTT